jgi:hypothetical protein
MLDIPLAMVNIGFDLDLVIRFATGNAADRFGLVKIVWFVSSSESKSFAIYLLERIFSKWLNDW